MLYVMHTRVEPVESYIAVPLLDSREYCYLLPI